MPWKLLGADSLDLAELFDETDVEARLSWMTTLSTWSWYPRHVTQSCWIGI